MAHINETLAAIAIIESRHHLSPAPPAVFPVPNFTSNLALPLATASPRVVMDGTSPMLEDKEVNSDEESLFGPNDVSFADDVTEAYPGTVGFEGQG